MDNPALQAILAQLSSYNQNAAVVFPPQAQQNDSFMHHAQPQPQTTPAAPSPRAMIDPASITTWQEGLRCVTKIAAQNARFAASIKRMIQTQHEHEKRWYTERQNLKRTQANRAVSSAKVDSILASLGTTMTKSAEKAPEVDKDAELLDFDQKVYAAQQAMEADMTAELKGLGVPFFGVNEGLVVPDGVKVKQDGNGDDVPKWSQTVTESEMMDLRRRMIRHLEDLYHD